MIHFFLKNETTDEPAYHLGGEDDMEAVFSALSSMMRTEIETGVEYGAFDIELRVIRKEMTDVEIAALPEI